MNDEIKSTVADLEKAMQERVIKERAGIENALYVLGETERVFALMKSNKPNDRSEEDRCWAIAITDMQKLVAFFKVDVAKKG